MIDFVRNLLNSKLLLLFLCSRFYKRFAEEASTVTPYSVPQLQEIFRKKNEKKGRKGDVEKSAQLVRIWTLGSVN